MHFASEGRSLCMLNLELFGDAARWELIRIPFYAKYGELTITGGTWTYLIMWNADGGVAA